MDETGIMSPMTAHEEAADGPVAEGSDPLGERLTVLDPSVWLQRTPPPQGAADIADEWRGVAQDYLITAHQAQTDLLREARVADDRAWVWHSHAELVASMGSPSLGAHPDRHVPDTGTGVFADAAEHAARASLAYCEGYRFPMATASPIKPGTVRHAWCRDPATGEVLDQQDADPSGWLYLGICFAQDFLAWFERRQPGHLPPAALRSHDPLLLDEAVTMTMAESLDEPLPLERPTADPSAAQSHSSATERAIQHVHQQVAQAQATARGPRDVRASKAPRFMGVLDHVGPGIDCLRHGLIYSSAAPDPDSFGLMIVNRLGDPPPF